MLGLQHIMADYDLELQRLDNGLEITRAPKNKTILKVEQRTEYKTRYLNGIYTPLEYVKSISSTIENENKRMDPFLLSQNDIDYMSDECTEPRCHVCLQQREEIFSLIHRNSGHGGFCEKCATELSLLNHGCPICRVKIDRIVQIFQ